MGRAARAVLPSVVALASTAFVASSAAARLMAAPGGVARTATFTPSVALQADVNADIGTYEADLHHTLGLTVIAGTVDHEIKTEDGNLIYANATPYNAKGKDDGPGLPVKCKIQETPLGVKKGPAFEALTMAHELFHCFQFDLRGTDTWKGMPLWVQEGTADWAATTIVPSSFELDNDFLELGKYFGHPRQPLFDRAYDASGFWGHIQDVTGDLWSVLPKVIRANDSRAAFVAAGADDAAVLNTWASSYLRNDVGGEPWEMHSPMVPPASNQDDLDSIPSPVLQLNGPSKVWAHPYTVIDYHFASMPAGEPLMHVGLHGYGRLSLTRNYTHLSDAWFCVDPQGCKCPPNTIDQLPNSQPLETDAYLAITGDPDDPGGTDGEITFHKLDEFCIKQAPPPNYHYGNGGSGGDPHVTTFDGAFYDFQAAGEFTLMKSTRDDLQVQVRQKPAVFGEFRIAFITAVAIRDAGATIEEDSAGQLYLDKRPLSLAFTRLPGGGSMTRLGSGRFGGVSVRWPDGTYVEVYAGSVIGMDVIVHAARDRRGRVRGLLGPYLGNTRHEFIGRSGIRYRAGGQFDQLPFGVLYGQYGNSWRITQKQSLFRYPRGKSTRSYTRLNYPPRATTFAGLSKAARARAKRTCEAAGIRLPAVLADCELDVGVTNDNAYVTGDQNLDGAVAGHQKPMAVPVIDSTIRWTELSSTSVAAAIVPSVASVAGKTVAVYMLHGQQSIEAATFGAGATGVSGISRNVSFTGWLGVNNPVLLPGDGRLRMIVPGVHSNNSSDPLNGTVIVTRNADGSFGPPTTLNSMIDYGVTSATLAADGTTPLWAANTTVPNQTGYRMLVVSGSTAQDLTSVAPTAPTRPVIGRDQRGRVWLAFSSNSEAGIYMLQLNPQTGAAIGGPQLAPRSAGPQAGQLTNEMACAQICRVVYVDEDANPAQVLTWAPGEKAAAVAFSGRAGGSDQSAALPIAAYTADGRLWVGWVNEDGGMLYAKLGDSTGAGGTPELLRSVPGGGENIPLQTAATAAGGRLVIATAWERTSTESDTVWATVVDPP
jgi:hypothetical protein